MPAPRPAPADGSDAHLLLTGTVSKLKSNFIFFRTPIGVVNVAIVDAASRGEKRFATGIGIGGAIADAVHAALAFVGIGKLVAAHPTWNTYLTEKSSSVTDLASQVRTATTTWSPTTAPAWSGPRAGRTPPRRRCGARR